MKLEMTLLSAVVIAVLVLLPLAKPVDMEAGEIPQLNLELTGVPWGSGQGMFYEDSLWRGGDCASSVDIGDGRVLWLFADSYVGIKPPYVRDICCVTMIRNCLGIQTGYDPSTAGFTVYWRGTGETPRAYFPADDSSWYWPGNAVKIDSLLVVFLMHICRGDTDLGFQECGHQPHAAYVVSGIERDPLEWVLVPLILPANAYGIMLGAATYLDPPYLFLLSVDVKDPGIGSMYLARWHTDSLLNGSAGTLEWWAGDSRAWVSDSELTSVPTAIFDKGATEFSVIYDDETDQYIAVQAVGFGAADIMIRTAPALTGPWSGLQLVYEPPEKSDSEIMIYAAKAHSWASGSGLAITYNTNGPVERIIADTTVYYPRLVKLNRVE
jgi:hypothetical protein